MQTKGWGAQGDAEEIHRAYMRRCLEVPSTAPNACVMHLTGRHPVMHDWLSRVLGWWNGVVARDASDLVRVALEDALHRHPDSPRCKDYALVPWAAQLQAALRSLTGDAGMTLSMCPVSVSSLMGSVGRLWTDGLWAAADGLAARLPESCPVRSVPDAERTGFTAFMCRSWFLATHGKGLGFVYCVNRAQRVRALGRLFCGAAGLMVEKHDIPGRDRRTCPCCSQQVREDALHLVLECPAYVDARSRFPALGLIDADVTDLGLRGVMTGGGNNRQMWNDLADFVLCALARRREIMRGHLAPVG